MSRFSTRIDELEADLERLEHRWHYRPLCCYTASFMYTCSMALIELPQLLSSASADQKERIIDLQKRYAVVCE